MLKKRSQVIDPVPLPVEEERDDEAAGGNSDSEPGLVIPAFQILVNTRET